MILLTPLSRGLSLYEYVLHFWAFLSDLLSSFNLKPAPKRFEKAKPTAEQIVQQKMNISTNARFAKVVLDLFPDLVEKETLAKAAGPYHITMNGRMSDIVTMEHPLFWKKITMVKDMKRKILYNGLISDALSMNSEKDREEARKRILMLSHLIKGNLADAHGLLKGLPYSNILGAIRLEGKVHFLCVYYYDALKTWQVLLHPASHLLIYSRVVMFHSVKSN